MGRKPKGGGGTKIEVLQRKNRAIKLHTQGLSLRQIADEMDLHNSTVYYYLSGISSALEIKHFSDIEHWRAVQLERLELYADVIHETLSEPEGATPDDRQARRLVTIQAGLKVMERTAKLLGLDEPAKVQDMTPRDAPYIIFGIDTSKPPADE